MNKVTVVQGYGEYLLQVEEKNGTYIIARSFDFDKKSKKWMDKLAKALNNNETKN